MSSLNMSSLVHHAGAGSSTVRTFKEGDAGSEARPLLNATKEKKINIEKHTNARSNPPNLSPATSELEVVLCKSIDGVAYAKVIGRKQPRKIS